MTVEELDIIVQASIEPALKELKKLMPQIKQQIGTAVDKAQKSLNSIDTKAVSKKIKDAFDPNDISGLKIDGKELVIRDIKGISKEVQRLKGHIEEVNSKKINPNVAIQSIAKPKPTPIMQNNLNTDSSEQTSEMSLWTKIVRQYYAYLDMAKAKMNELKQKTEETSNSQNKLNANIGKSRSGLNKMSAISIKVSNSLKGIGTPFKMRFEKHIKICWSIVWVKKYIYDIKTDCKRMVIKSKCRSPKSKCKY